MSSRAEMVAEILWELKRANKLATFALVAERAGFSAGANGRTIESCLKKVRTDWPHLQWWRIVDDNCRVHKGSEQDRELQRNGFEMEPVGSQEKLVKPLSVETHLISWGQISASTA